MEGGPWAGGDREKLQAVPIVSLYDDLEERIRRREAFVIPGAIDASGW